MNSEKITTVCLATCDRSESLHLALSGLVENFTTHNRTPRILIVDDSEIAEHGARSKEIALAFQSTYGGKIEYLDREDRLQMAKAIAGEKNIPERLMTFALLGNKLSNTTVGSARNTCLLKTIGEKMLMLDDDTVLKLYEPVPAEDAIFTEDSPMDFFFLNKDEPLPQQFKSVDFDFLSVHETQLGKASEEILEGNPEMQGYRILDTYMGLYGDSPMASHLTLLFSTQMVERVRTMSQAEYERVKSTRHIIQTPLRPTLYQGALNMSMCRGIDNREMPPPFMPVGRAEDLVFGVVREKAYPLYLSFYMPLLVGHQRPAGTSTAGSLGIYEYTKMNRIIAMLLQGTHVVGLDTVDNLEILGKSLSGMALQPEAAFLNFMEEARKHALQLVSSNLSGLLEKNTDMPNFWTEDIQSILHDLETVDPNKFLIDVPEAPDENRMELFRSWLSLYGELLQTWSEVIAD